MAARMGVWLLHMALPLLGLWLLLAQPEADVEWRHQPSHFAIVSLAALLSVALAVLLARAALQRADGRLFLISLSLTASSSLFLLHGLLTPGVLVPDRGVAFDLSQAVGLGVGSTFAVAASLERAATRARALVADAPLWILGLVAVLTLWGIAATLRIPPLDDPALGADGSSTLIALGVLTVPLYLVAASRFYALYRRQPSVVTISIITAFVLLAEAMVAAVVGRTWRLSWWEWHLLLLAAYGFVAYSAFVAYAREGTAAGLFAGIGLQENVRAVADEHHEALRRLLETLRARAMRGEAVDARGAAAELRGSFPLTERQLELLGPTAEMLREIDALFLRYTSPAIAAALWQNPRMSELGGRTHEEVTVLFADLRGFTAFSEAAERDEIFEMLNRTFALAVPEVLSRGGTLDKFVGDAMMALFGVPNPDPESAEHAVAAALAIQRATAALVEERADWPRFRIGINAGPVMFGNVGSEQFRNVTAIGDTVNVAARLEEVAEPGQIVVGERVFRRLADMVEAKELGELEIRGRRNPVRAWVVLGLRASPSSIPRP